MRNGVDIKKLSEVSDILKSKVPYFEGEKKYFSTKGINNDGDYQSVNVTYNNKPSRAGLFPEINNVGFAKMKGTNKVFIVDKILKDSLFSTGFMILKCKDLIIPKYLFWFLLSENFLKQKDFLSGDGIMGGLKNSSHAEISIRIPELSEQKEIVEILDQAFESIEKAKANIEKNIENAKELYQSKLNQTFSQKNEDWEQVSLGNLGKITSSKRIYKKEYVNSGIPYYRSKEIKELAHGKRISLQLFIEKTRYEDIKRDFGVPKVGDILVTAIGATIGEIYVIENDNPFYFKDGNVLWLKDFNCINPDYLKLCLKYFLDNILSITRGSAYPALTIEKLKKYMVYVPPNDIQENIVETLDTMDNHIESVLLVYKEELANLEELKKSILQKAFSGELTNKNKAA